MSQFNKNPPLTAPSPPRKNIHEYFFPGILNTHPPHRSISGNVKKAPARALRAKVVIKRPTQTLDCLRSARPRQMKTNPKAPRVIPKLSDITRPLLYL